MVLFFVSELFIDIANMKVIKVTLVIQEVNMFSKNILLKLNLISCHGNKSSLKCHKGSRNWRLERVLSQTETI